MRKFVLAAAVLLAAVLPVSAPARQATNPFWASSGALSADRLSVAAEPIHGLDLHDGTIQKFGSTYYLYGTEYGCGFSWRSASPWCGFGVSTAPSLAGPWSTPTLLFSPHDTVSAQAGWSDNSRTWQSLCGDTGSGCFNPRMLQRPDGVFVLWFNAPADYTIGNGYYSMGCNGPTGGCGAGAGGPHGSTRKPSLWKCGNSNGDFSIAGAETGSPVILCVGISAYDGISEEQLNQWWTDGDGIGSSNIAGLGQTAGVEGEGAYQDPLSGRWVMTYSDPECGYCTGAASGYATASSLLGPWSYPYNAYQAGGPAHARAQFSAGSCGGQPRTVFVVDGQAYEWIDLWQGSANETGAAIRIEPLSFTPNNINHPGDAQVWNPEVAPYSC